MIQAIVKIDEDTNRIINVMKAKYGLRDKSEAINMITREYGEGLLEPMVIA